MSGVLILGATSTIARAVAHEFASHGHDVALAGRDAEELGRIAADLHLRYGIQARTLVFDALDFPAHQAVVDGYFAEADGGSNGVVLCLGYLGDQAMAQEDFGEARRILDANFTACVSLLNRAAEHLERRGEGFICALSSVAGDRGRQSNYIYGAAKGGLSVYLQGLRNRLFHSGVRVITVKPGFVDTQMTFGRPGLFLVAAPEKVARGIYRTVVKGGDAIYIPKFWSLIMLLIRSLPEPVFKRLRL